MGPSQRLAVRARGKLPHAGSCCVPLAEGIQQSCTSKAACRLQEPGIWCASEQPQRLGPAFGRDQWIHPSRRKDTEAWRPSVDPVGRSEAVPRGSNLQHAVRESGDLRSTGWAGRRRRPQPRATQSGYPSCAVDAESPNLHGPEHDRRTALLLFSLRWYKLADSIETTS